MAVAETSLEYRGSKPDVDIGPWRPALAPRLLTKINCQRTMDLIGGVLDLPREDRTRRAIQILEMLAEAGDMASQREWSIKFNICALKGPETVRRFLVDQGMLEGGKFLRKPEVIIPGMEYANIVPERYEPPLNTYAQWLSNGMFADYFAVKDMLAPPSQADLVAAMASLPVVNILTKQLIDRLTPPKLRRSLLLMPYVEQIIREVETYGDEN